MHTQALLGAHQQAFGGATLLCMTVEIQPCVYLQQQFASLTCMLLNERLPDFLESFQQ